MLAWIVLLGCGLPLGCAWINPGASSPAGELAVPADAAYVQAALHEKPPPPPQVVPVPAPVPLPGQLKLVEPGSQGCPICLANGIPIEKQRPDHTHKAHEIIEYANQQARKGPEVHGYIDSVQVYAYMPGALFQVYTAPTSVTAVMLCYRRVSS
jgi:type IV secretion system protein VirB9